VPVIVRLGVQEQGRAAVARRGCRLSADRRSTCRGIQGIDPGHGMKCWQRDADDDEPFSALAFKIMNDPFVGSLTFCRIYSGKLDLGFRRAAIRVKDQQGARRPHAADACEQPRRHQGSLRWRHRRAGRPEGHHHRRHALRSDDKPVILETMEFPSPVIEVAVEPKTKADQEKTGHRALQRLAAGRSVVPRVDRR